MYLTGGKQINTVGHQEKADHIGARGESPRENATHDFFALRARSRFTVLQTAHKIWAGIQLRGLEYTMSCPAVKPSERGNYEQNNDRKKQLPLLTGA